MSETLQILLIVLIGGLIHGTVGFGFGLFTMGTMTLLMPVADAVSIVSVINLSSTLLNLWTLRDHTDWPESWPILWTALPTTILGVYLLRNLNGDILRAGVAAMILMGCGVTLWSPHKARIHKATPWAHLSGLVGGLFGGALNTGGPPVVLYTLLRGWDKSKTKSVMSVYFIGTGILRVALLIGTGIATPDRLQQSLIVLLPALSTAYLGTRIFRQMSTPVFRYAVMGLLAALAMRLILT